MMPTKPRLDFGNVIYWISLNHEELPPSTGFHAMLILNTHQQELEEILNKYNCYFEITTPRIRCIVDIAGLNMGEQNQLEQDLKKAEMSYKYVPGQFTVHMGGIPQHIAFDDYIALCRKYYPNRVPSELPADTCVALTQDT